MALNIQPSTSIERKLLFLETLLNGTSKVSKVSDNSVLSGFAGGVAKIAGKAEKDIMLAVSQLFPDTAYSDQLDQVALNFGIAPRFGALGASTYVKITATPGTTYIANNHTLISTNGTRFTLEQDTTVGSMGFIYTKVRSTTIGNSTNVEPLTITQITPQPNGHLSVINEYVATGGRDVEDDEMFRVRIKNGSNILARGTIAMLEQLFMSINNKVLKIFHQGTNRLGKVVIAIATQNGVNLSSNELDELLAQSADYFSLTEYRPIGTSFSGIELINIEYFPIDISFRVDIDNSYNSDDIRISIQNNISKYLDFRYFDPSVDKVDWINLIEIVKNTPGIRNVPDQYFYPRTNITVDSFCLPRVRSFLMLNLSGQVIANYTGTLSPVYYPSVIDESFHQTILNA
jgi:Baseplate J-like protein